jgi:hypothetical protein
MDSDEILKTSKIYLGQWSLIKIPLTSFIRYTESVGQ